MKYTTNMLSGMNSSVSDMINEASKITDTYKRKNAELEWIIYLSTENFVHDMSNRECFIAGYLLASENVNKIKQHGKVCYSCPSDCGTDKPEKCKIVKASKELK